MSNNPNEVNNFEELMFKYLKDKDQMLNNYDYQTPLKEISPIEPLIFQNDILPRNNQFDMNMQNFNPRFEKDINIPNNLSNRSDYIGMNDNNKFITPSKPNNKNSSNINSFINSSIEREKALKEEKKKKQMEYQKMLDEQIKEKRLRQQKEKEKRLQEELLYEEKLKLEKEKFERENNQNKNINKFQNNNLISREQPIQINAKMPQFSKNLMMDNEMEENLQNEMINNAMKRANSQKYLEIMNNNIFPQNQNPKYPQNQQYREDGEEDSPENLILQNQNLNRNIPPQQISIEHLVSTSSQIPGQILNPLNQNHPQYKTQNNYYPGSRQNQNLSQNAVPNLNNMNYPQSQPSPQDLNPYMTQRQYYESRQKLHRMPSSDLGSNTNISIAPSNFPTSYQIPFNNNLINSSPNPINFNSNSQNVNELLNINNQNYFGKIMEIFFHEQEKILESYKETIEKLKNERDEAIYKNKANEQKILALQKLQNDQECLEKNLGYFPFKNNYQQNMEKTLDSIMQKNEDFNYNNYNENKIMNINENDSKKIETSLSNINNNSNISDSKLVSLITSTKFVKVNNGDGKKLLETWKKEEEDDNKNNNNFNYDYKEVKEKINNNQNLDENNKDNQDVNNDNNNNKKFKLSGMDTNAFMEKISMINNKILEPPDEPKNYIEDSIISKTQKNEEKSFANEISNRNVNEEINNINKKNIDDDDNIISNKNNNIVNNYISNDINEKENKFNNFNYKDNIINESDINMQKYLAEMKGKDVMLNMLNNVHNAVMQNLDNNISISTQIKEKLEEKKKQQEINNNNNAIKISVIAEKEYQGVFRDSTDEENKNKYNNYSIKQVNCSSSKLVKVIDSQNEEMKKKEKDSILINPPLKNIDNNITISKSKNNYSLFVSKHVKNEEKNPFENIVSINDEEETQSKNINNKNINININMPGEEENNDLPNLDSPKNDYKTIQTFGMPNNNNNNTVTNKNENNNTSKSIARKEEEILNRLNFFEDDDNILASKIKLDKKESKNNNINNINIDNDSFLKNNSNLIYNNKNNESKHSVRPPTDLTGDKIISLNNLYDEFKKKKDHINETNNSISNNNINNIGNNSLMNESLNTFTQNLNIKWKDLTKKDINNIKMNREQLYNDDNNYSHLDDDDNFKDEKIFDKVNQFTRVALNELKQSQLSVFSKDKTFKKHE